MSTINKKYCTICAKAVAPDGMCCGGIAIVENPEVSAAKRLLRKRSKSLAARVEKARLKREWYKKKKVGAPE